VGSVFRPVRFLLPVCRLSWFLYTLNIYAHFSSHFSQQHYIYLFFLSTLRYDSIHIRTKYEDTGLKAKWVLFRQSSIWSLWPNIRSLPSILLPLLQFIFICCMLSIISLVYIYMILYALEHWVSKFCVHSWVLFRQSSIWSLWPNIRSLPSIVAEKNVTKNVHICSMCIETN
jgi:uncharacterized protein YbdZ (MbtH family)